MFKKIVSIFILSQFLFTSAFAGEQDLKNAFDELSYSLTVEWDQKDPEFSRNALRTFSNQVAELRAQGLTDAEMANVFKSMLNHSADAQVDHFVANLRTSSPEKSMQELQKIAGLSYDQGASFSPGKYILIGAGVVATVFVAGLLMWELSDPQIFGEDGWK